MQYVLFPLKLMAVSDKLFPRISMIQVTRMVTSILTLVKIRMRPGRLIPEVTVAQNT